MVGRIRGGKQPNKHKQLRRIVPEWVGPNCLCASLFPGERGKHINKIPKKSQEKAETVPAQSRDNPENNPVKILFMCFLVIVEIPWTWEKESRGQKPKSLQKVSKKSPGPGVPKVRKKSRKRSEKSPKTHFQTFWRLFGPFSRLFSDFWDPAAGRPRETFSRLFGDFLAFGPETPSPRSTESQCYCFFLPALRMAKLRWWTCKDDSRHGYDQKVIVILFRKDAPRKCMRRLRRQLMRTKHMKAGSFRSFAVSNGCAVLVIRERRNT